MFKGVDALRPPLLAGATGTGVPPLEMIVAGPAPWGISLLPVTDDAGRGIEMVTGDGATKLTPDPLGAGDGCAVDCDDEAEMMLFFNWAADTGKGSLMGKEGVDLLTGAELEIVDVGLDGTIAEPPFRYSSKCRLSFS